MKHINRRQFLQAAGVSALAAASPEPIRCAAQPKRPGGLNVLFLMTDEQHHRSLSLTGNPYIETPNMDRIGREGVCFENATCVTPYCSPSRASMITGVYPHRHGILLNVGGRGSRQAPLAQDAFPNTETLLHRRGYATAFRGKWHLGDLGDFDCYESFDYGGTTRRDYQAFLDARLPAAQFANHPSPGKYLGRPVEMIPAIEKAYHAFINKSSVGYISIIGRSLIPPDLLPETLVTNQVIELLEKNADKNFMITASWIPPHDLWVIPEPYYSMVDRKKIELAGTTSLPPWDQRGASKQLGDLAGPEGIREYAAIYHGMVKYIDDQVGRVLKKLDELGLAGNTLVIFTSDHGDMVGAHGCIGKSITGCYDDLVRIPLLMRLPGRIEAGTRVRQPVSQIDFMPTILDYAGVPVPENIHGKSLRPLIEGRKVAWRDYAFCQRANTLRMLRTEQYKYVVGAGRRIVALYDLIKDPHEDRNLADDPAHAPVLKAMHKRLLEVMAADGDSTRDFAATTT
ncbi:MAG: sulfatase-like hydrolase/transferase [Candidatus Sumerlaeia bacterium]|nr:sulfatase-like hydrolase/transferase [Candidatus Sumerlaeia bacterium]